MAKSKRKEVSNKKSTVELNEQFNYRLKPRHLTEDEHKEWAKFKKGLELQDIGKEDNINYIHSFYCNVMNTKVSKPEVNSSRLPLIHMMDKIDIVYNSYK